MSEAEIPSAIPAAPRPRPAPPLRVAGCLLLLGGVGILLASTQEAPVEAMPPGTVTAHGPQPPLLPPGYWEQTRSTAPELVGPPAPPRQASADKPFPVGGSAGPIGFIGPIPGPLSADAGAGPVYGPGWDGKPLPNVVAGPPIPLEATDGKSPAPAAPADPASSELPDERTLALSRLANPQLEVRQAPQVKPATATAENPLTVQVALKGDGFRAGEPVTVRVTANMACYAALVLVNSAGKSSTVFQSPRPTKEFTCLLKAGPTPGAEYLLAVASTQPLSAAEMAPSLRATPISFAAPRAPQTAGEAPSAAWTLAVAHVDGLDGSSRKLQRFEWSAGAATFVTQSPAVAVGKPQTTVPPRKDERKPERKEEAPKPPAEESILPKPDPGTPREDAKPAPGEPKSGAKPAETPAGGNGSPLQNESGRD